jgi:Mn-containing catalase
MKMNSLRFLFSFSVFLFLGFLMDLSSNTGNSYTPKNGDVVADARGDLFLVSMDRTSDTIALIPVAPTRSDPNVYEYASWRSREMQLGLRDLTGTSVERADKVEAQLNQSAIDGIVSVSTSGKTGSGSYTPKNGDVVADARGDLFLVSMDRTSDTIALIPVAPTRSDPNVYEYASWRSREMQLGLRDLTGTSVERADKVEAQLNQSAIDGIVSVSTSGKTGSGSYTPKNGDVVADARGDLFLVSMDRTSDTIALIPVAPTRSDPNVYEYASWRSREMQLGLRDLTGTSVERADKVEAQLNQSAIDGIVSVSTSGKTGSGSYTPKNGDVVADARGDLFLVSMDRTSDTIALIPVAPTRSDPNVYEYASWRSREMQLGLRDLTGTSVERADKVEAQLNQSAIDGIVSVSTSGKTGSGSYTPKNGDVVADARGDLFLVSMDRTSDTIALIPVAPTRSDPNVYEYASWRSREMQLGLRDLTGTSVERADKVEAQLNQSAIDGIVSVSTSGKTGSGSYTPKNGDVVADARGDLFLVSMDRTSDTIALIPVAPTRSDPNVYEYASWRSREMQLGLRDLTGTSVERADKVEAQLNQSAIDGIVSVSTSGKTGSGSYTPKNGDVVADARGDLFLVSMDRTSDTIALIPVAPTRSDPNVYEYASWRSREMQLGLRDLTGTSVERADKVEAQLNQSAIDGIVSVSTSGKTGSGSYTPKNGDVVADARGDLFLVSMDRTSDTIALIPVAPTRSDPNVYEYASWRSREMQLGLRDLTGTSVERADKVEAQLNQSAIDGIVSVSTSGKTGSGSYTPKNGDVVADARGDLFLVSMDRTSDTIALIPVAPTRSDPNVYEYASWRSREMQLGLRDLTGTSVERADKVEAQLNQSAIDGIVSVSTSGKTGSGSYTPKNGDVVADARGDLFLVSMDRTSDTIALIPVAPTRSDPNVYEYASWRSREMQLGLRDLTGTSVERADKVEAQLNQSAIDGIVSVSTSGKTGSGSYTPKNGDVVADARGDLFLVSMDRTSDTIALIPVAPTRSDPNVYEYASWRSREMQLGLRDLTGTSVERADKVEAQLNQSAIDGIVSVSTSGKTGSR